MHEPTWPPLVCTRCGADVWVELQIVGAAYQTYEIVDCISCEKCGAEWDKGGKPKATTWLATLDEEVR